MDHCAYSNLCPVVRYYGDNGGVCLMVYYRLCSVVRYLSVCALSCLILSFPVLAADAASFSESMDEVGEAALAPEPSPVYIVSPDVDLTDFLDAPDEYHVYSVDPENVVSPMALPSGEDFPFFGSNWAIGAASGLGEVSLFWPSDRGEGYIGLDASGRLYNVSSTSITGVMYASNGSAYTVSFGSFSLPRYRLSSGPSYDYETLYFVPERSNLVLPDSPRPVYSVSDLLPWVSILLLGGVFLRCIRK